MFCVFSKPNAVFNVERFMYVQSDSHTHMKQDHLFEFLSQVCGSTHLSWTWHSNQPSALFWSPRGTFA